MRNTMRWILPLLLMFVFGSGACLAQSTNAGDIRGSVTDASGALIPGVKVTVLNVDTGVANEYTTNNSGLYDTNSIIPGHYQITFTRDGFDVLVRGPITLEVGFTTVNGQLKIGSTNEQITVTSDVPLLTTENGEQTTVLDAKSMDELPQVTPNWESFVILLPGAAGTSSSSPGQQAAINGNLPYSNVLSDGASTTLGQSMNANADCIDAVEWCKLHVHWLPGRINPNLQAERWAHRHGKPMIACSDAHTLATIGRNASTVEADELTAESIFAGIRAGRISFHRHSLRVAPLAYETTKALLSQPRHLGRWVKRRLANPGARA